MTMPQSSQVLLPIGSHPTNRISSDESFALQSRSGAQCLQFVPSSQATLEGNKTFFECWGDERRSHWLSLFSTSSEFFFRKRFIISWKDGRVCSIEKNRLVFHYICLISFSALPIFLKWFSLYDAFTYTALMSMLQYIDFFLPNAKTIRCHDVSHNLWPSGERKLNSLGA